MPNLSNVTAVHEGGTVRVRGSKGSSITVRVYLNPNLEMFPTVEALFDGWDQITTPKAQDSSSNVTFDLTLTVATGRLTPLTVKVCSSDGKGDSPLVTQGAPAPIVVDPGMP